MTRSPGRERGVLVDGDQLEPLENFETWLLRRVAQAVEAGEVSADLLIELRTEIEASRDKPQEHSHSDAVRDIAVELQMRIEKVRVGMAVIEAQPCVVREALVRRIAEGWVAGQWQAHDGKGR